MPRRARPVLTFLALIGLTLQLFIRADVTNAAGFTAQASDIPDTGAADSPVPEIHTLIGATPFLGDLRSLPLAPQSQQSITAHEEHMPTPGMYGSGSPAPNKATPLTGAAVAPGMRLQALAPSPTRSFNGLDFATWGTGHPPDANGDVGPAHYIQAINSAVGIYDKSTGAEVASFSLNSLMSQGQFGNPCDTDNQGNPIVLYDTFEDRWVITDIAYQLDSSQNVVSPPGAFVCFAVSRSGDPVTGGWSFYSINTAGGLGDDARLGIWPDGIYMSVNMKTYSASRTFQNPRVYAFNKARMYAGTPAMQSVSFDAPASDFMLLPSNARLQTGTPPAGTPNYFVSTWQFLNALTVYQFSVDWDRIALSTFTGPTIPLAATSWPNATVPDAPSLGGNSLEVVPIQAMMQNQYSNIGGVESLWATHTVRRANTAGFAAPRWYQVNVTGGNVAATLPQAATWDPDAANIMHRFVPSLAVNRAGDLALGYSRSSATTNPAIAYAGRLSNDPINIFSQTEQVLIHGAGTQVGSSRWGSYSSMTLDPDGCTFWYTNQYYAADGLDYRTRIGAFSFPSCTPVGGGTLQGSVTHNGSPVSGATVALGSRTTTTDASGNYQFTALAAGIYPTLTASGPGLNPASVSSVAITDGGTTTQDFALAAAPASGCFTDTTQADFQQGEPTSCDLTTSPGTVTLLDAPTIDQQNTSLSTIGTGITTTTWGGQTFTPAVAGDLVRVDINLFCSGCTGTIPDLTLSVRATSGGLPTGADLATATIPGFSSGAAEYHTATFASPVTLTAGTMYALVIRPVANPSPGTYALTRSGNNAYPGGTRVAGATSGTAWSTPLISGVSTDAGFKTYVQTGYSFSGELVSGTKDANPAAGSTPTWTSLAWNSTTPAGTAVQFQVAASNNQYGPFTFVGPDGTAATYFTTSGASLSQFNGNRYLKYRAYLETTDSTLTPALADVTVCFSNLVNTSLAVAAATGPYGGSTTLSATLTAGGSAVSGETISFTLNGTTVGSAVTDASGVATLSGVSLAGINANTYAGGVGASFPGSTGYGASANTNTLTVTPAQSTTTVTCPASVLYDGTAQTPCSAAYTTTDGLSGSLSVSYLNNTNTGTASASAGYPGDANHLASSDSATFTISLATSTTTVTCPASVTYDGTAQTPCSAGYTTTDGLSGSLSVSYLNNTNAGTATASASYPGDADHAGSSDTVTFTIGQAPSTTTLSCPASVTYTGAALTPCTASVSGVGGLSTSVSVSYANNINVGTATASASYPGDANHLASSDTVTFTIDPDPLPTVTIEPAVDQPTVATAAPLRFTVTFDIAVTGFGDQPADLVLSGSAPGALSAAVTGGPSIYTVTVSGMTGPGTVSVSVAAGAAANAIGTPSAASKAPASVTFAPVTPIVTGLVRLDPSPTNASGVRYQLTFSEAVAGVDTASLPVTTSDLAGTAVTSLIGSGTTYTVTVGTGSGDGTLQLVLHDDDRIRSVASGVALGGSGSGNGDFSGEIYVVDRTAPSIVLDAHPLMIDAGTTPTYTLALTISDNLAVQLSSLSSAALRISGPGSATLSATLVSVTPAGDGTPRRATFAVAGPGGSWTPAAAGVYHVDLVGEQIYDTAGNSASATDLGSFMVRTTYQVQLPLIVVAPPQPALPDLAVAAIRITGSAIEVEVVNQGSAPVTQPFWVDAYLNPDRAPLHVNEIWQMVGDAGLVWGVDAAALPLAPGERLTLRVGDAFYRSELSAMPGALTPATPVYVQVDSANTATAYGAVLETHERDDGPYNNIASTAVPAGGAALRAPESDAPATRPQGTTPMPARPILGGAS